MFRLTSGKNNWPSSNWVGLHYRQHLSSYPALPYTIGRDVWPSSQPAMNMARVNAFGRKPRPWHIYGRARISGFSMRTSAERRDQQAWAKKRAWLKAGQGLLEFHIRAPYENNKKIPRGPMSKDQQVRGGCGIVDESKRNGKLGWRGSCLLSRLLN